MIIVTGASGQLGRDVVKNLLGRVPAGQVVASMRDRSKGEDLEQLGVAVREADFAQSETLPAAFAGADQVLVVSANKLGEEARRLHRNATLAAKAAGVGRLLYTSHMGARDGSPFAPADQHAHTEADLAESDLAFTALRHGFYAESCLLMVGDALRNGALRVPADGPVSWTARADLAEADAVILASNGQWDGATPPLTASRAITMAELADIASEVFGHTVRHQEISDEQWLEEQVAAGRPAFVGEMLLGTFRAARNGDFAATDATLETLLGRPSTTMQQVLAAAAPATHGEDA